MAIWMDAHEKGGMEALVREHCDDVSVSDSFGGDYAAGGYLIERKRWQEVVGRMTEQDRNLFYQVSKLCTAAGELGLEPALLLEGEIGGAVAHSSVPADAVAKYLAGLPVMGVTVVPSTGRACSAAILARLEDGEPPDVRRVRGTPGDESHRERFVIEGFPGVGPATAEDLLDHFGSVRAVVSATADELQEVGGVGPATAESITGTADP
jgi:Fanconi anemia group M protein